MLMKSVSGIRGIWGKEFTLKEVHHYAHSYITTMNISEGSIGQSKPEFRRFLGYAIRSLAEVVTCLHKSINRNYTSKGEFTRLYNDSYHLMNMMVAFKNKI